MQSGIPGAPGARRQHHRIVIDADVGAFQVDSLNRFSEITNHVVRHGGTVAHLVVQVNSDVAAERKTLQCDIANPVAVDDHPTAAGANSPDTGMSSFVVDVIIDNTDLASPPDPYGRSKGVLNRRLVTF